MKANNIQSLAIFLCIAILFASCRSNTMIYSSPTAKVYKKDKFLGETPYKHSDIKLTGMATKYRLEAEGHQPLDIKFRRLQRANGMTIFLSLPLIFPALWIGHYARYQSFDLTPLNDAKKINADYLKINEPFKVSKKGFPIYIGEDRNTHYAYVNGEIIGMNNRFEEIESYKVFDNERAYSTGPIDAFIFNGNKYVLDVNPKNNFLRANVLDSKSNNYTIDLKEITHRREIINPEVQFGYDRAEKGKEIIAYNENQLYHYNINFELIENYSTDNSFLEAKITKDGRIISLESDGEKIYIKELGLNGKIETVDLVNARDMYNFRLNINEKLNKVYVSYLISPLVTTEDNKKKDENEDFISQGVHLISYELSSLEQTNTKTILFNDEIIEKAEKGTKNGIKYLINRGVKANEKNTYINLEEQWITIVTSENSSKRNLNANGIITINAAKENTPMDYIRKRGLSAYEYERLSYNQIINGDRIHYLFNDNIFKMSRPIVQQIVYDSDMNRLSQDIEDLYKEEKTLINTARSYPLEGEKHLIFHARKKRLGVGIIDFEAE